MSSGPILLKILLLTLRNLLAVVSGVLIYNAVPSFPKYQIGTVSQQNYVIATYIFAFLLWGSVNEFIKHYTDYNGYQLVQLARSARREGLVIKPKQPPRKKQLGIS